ncbi:FecR family protein [Longitalea luteola]|uniref:FecR family protein n=1 Tax=Longitalea luteola TaxID=2812563 RepID=UPI001A960FA1|nr:FecR domain-containing protein [Longitalea luteola]
MEERIKYLFRQYLNNTCSRKEFEEFFSYINEASHNELIRELIQKAYEETRPPDPSLTYVDESGNLIIPQPAWEEQAVADKRPPKKRAVVVMVACLMIILAGLAWLIYPFDQQNTGNAKAVLAKKMTGRSEYKYMLLPDSTQVWLNAASTLEYPNQFAAGKREVFLTGEAYFDVKHADKIPFVIHTGKVTTMVLGTAFNIKAYPGRENIIVSVSRGKVRVHYDKTEVATLTQGQQVKVSNSNKPVVQKKLAVNEVASWQQGNLVYDDETISDIVADLERIYDVNIRLENEAVAMERISTSFRREIGIEPALQVLCNLTDTRLQLISNMYVIE